ncbi:hypothetical protein GGD40_001852 [Paraburkholderia bryophila]|uniref:Uncharacterized protein n=1 Tax=Paraburkholderia bryophila TaxID=420952 RepID=A0A7Y9WM85_9BURK|nr:hypothetical protein [Paraburkholderia bryophila]
MHAPYAAQYCVIGGSGAGSGGSFTPEAAATSVALAAAVSEAPLSALVAEAGLAAIAVAFEADAAAVALAELAGLVALVALLALAPDAPVAAVATGALAPAALAAAGMPMPGGVAEKLLGGKGGREGTPVDEVLVTAGWRGGICDSCAMLTLVCLFAAA